MKLPETTSENAGGKSSGLGGKKYLVMGMVALAIGVGLFCFANGRKKVLFSEAFQSALNWERQCTRADTDGTPVMPAAGGRFSSAGPSTESGMLHLHTGTAEHVGGGEWQRTVDILADEKTRIEWKWTAPGCEAYQFWIRIDFNNHRRIFYMASDSKPPGLYRGERFVPYKGKKYRDGEGRARFFPSVRLLVGVPGDNWRMVRRSIAEDYIKSYGGLPDDFRITDITIGMMDDSAAAGNEMGMAYLNIYSSKK